MGNIRKILEALNETRIKLGDGVLDDQYVIDLFDKLAPEGADYCEAKTFEELKSVLDNDGVTLLSDDDGLDFLFKQNEKYYHAFYSNALVDEATVELIDDLESWFNDNFEED